MSDIRDVEVQVLWVRYNSNFDKEVIAHHTTVGKLIYGDVFPYKDVEIIAMRQYTGVKDASESKVFEGDIVRDPDDEVYEVKFVNGQFTLHAYGMDYYYWGDVEVIGNIHQNSELLK